MNLRELATADAAFREISATAEAAKAIVLGRHRLSARDAIHAAVMERHGISPDRGPVVVTGAAGGVGSVAISILSRLGYHIVASTGRTEEESYLRDLGAAEIISRDELSGPRHGHPARRR